MSKTCLRCIRHKLAAFLDVLALQFRSVHALISFTGMQPELVKDLEWVFLKDLGGTTALYQEMPSHEELQKAWQALIKAQFPPKALFAFNRIDQKISYLECDRRGKIGRILGSKDSLAHARLAKELAAGFREQYTEVRRLAEAGH